jgi:hypothetical protein
MTFRDAAAACGRLIVWCKACQHQVEPEAAEMAARYGPGDSVSIGEARLSRRARSSPA